eukprot:gene10096-13571_t
MLKSGSGKVFNDPIHGHIELSLLAVKIVDTPQFQRLRDISQLGGVYYVFPAASSKRFEHCIGVSYLSRYFVEQLRNFQPELGITDQDVLCLEIAGLCHDLGHGPFSHLFDGNVLPALRNNSRFVHEHASIGILDILIEENNLITEFIKYGLNEEDVHFIKELILGDEHDAPDGFKWKGRPNKSFLYDIVANKRNGIDVDKFDYFSRDCHVLGLNKGFDALRLMKFARVFTVSRNSNGNVLKCDDISHYSPLIKSQYLQNNDNSSSLKKRKVIPSSNITVTTTPIRTSKVRKSSIDNNNINNNDDNNNTINNNDEIKSVQKNIWKEIKNNVNNNNLENILENDENVNHNNNNNNNNNISSTQLEICFHAKEAWNILELFHTRYALHKRAYQHRVSKAVELMISEAFILSDPYILIPGRSNNSNDDEEPILRKMSECPDDLHAYWKLGEYIIRQIENSPMKELKQAQLTLKRLRKRDLFSFVGEIILSPQLQLKLITSKNKFKSNKNITKRVQEEILLIKHSLEMLHYDNNNDNIFNVFREIDDKDIFCTVVKMGYGKGNLNPVLDSTVFYRPKKNNTMELVQYITLEANDNNDNNNNNGSIYNERETHANNNLHSSNKNYNHIYQSLLELKQQQNNNHKSTEIIKEEWEVGVVPSDSISRLIPKEFEETYVRIFTRYKHQRPYVQLLFQEWCDAHAVSIDFMAATPQEK